MNATAHVPMAFHTCEFHVIHTDGSCHTYECGLTTNLCANARLHMHVCLQVKVDTKSRVYNRMVVHTGQPDLAPDDWEPTSPVDKIILESGLCM